ncbi:hypothetical protein CMUS01_14546 [Colletotrichum musicola]|uniref:Uncharacterized protein n=1 Tax=Colletotrichum musicola TaxID=2175873 RepID=A0A8H6MRM4_9PEZI|nr:hypothetical protein CMUS01_14546 [Colletotrichum musicola]
MGSLERYFKVLITDHEGFQAFLTFDRLLSEVLPTLLGASP